MSGNWCQTNVKALVLSLNSYPEVMLFNIFLKKDYSEISNLLSPQFIPLFPCFHLQEIKGNVVFCPVPLGKGPDSGCEELPSTLAREGGDNCTVLYSFTTHIQGTKIIWQF